MLKSVWKPEDEIEAALVGMERIAIISCGVCANMCGTGGSKGIKIMKGLAKKWGKQVVVAKCVNGCCCHEIMIQAKKVYLTPVAQKCDALIMLSCASGIKSAYMTDLKMPVIAALDSVGGAVVTHKKGLVAESLCVGCGQCVLSFTGGICPVSKCPSKQQYSPCKQYPLNGTKCAVDPERDCVWKEIEKIGDMAALKKLEQLHKQKNRQRIASHQNPVYPGAWRGFAGWAMTRTGKLAWIFKSIV